jgi:hypothetical protein
MNCMHCRAGRLTRPDPKRALWLCPACHTQFVLLKDEEPANPPMEPTA